MEKMVKHPGFLRCWLVLSPCCQELSRKWLWSQLVSWSPHAADFNRKSASSHGQGRKGLGGKLSGLVSAWNCCAAGKCTDMLWHFFISCEAAQVSFWANPMLTHTYIGAVVGLVVCWGNSCMSRNGAQYQNPVFWVGSLYLRRVSLIFGVTHILAHPRWFLRRYPIVDALPSLMQTPDLPKMSFIATDGGKGALF